MSFKLAFKLYFILSPPPRLKSSFLVPKLPPSARTLTPVDLRVKIWITPPRASEPYKLERGPRTISMRSICDTSSAVSENFPVAADEARTPSIKVSV